MGWYSHQRYVIIKAQNKKEGYLSMDMIKIGKFLCALRKEQNLTQEQLGEKLGVSNKTISRWENGNYMPPVEMLLELSKFYNISINEILNGERITKQEDFKQVAEKNLKEVLSQSAFTTQERKDYLVSKWKKDNLFYLVLNFVLAFLIIILGCIFQKNILIVLGIIYLLVFKIVSYNKMMIYVEQRAFKNPMEK